MAKSLNDAAKKQRMAELEAERQEIEAQLPMGKVQTTGRLSELNSRMAEVVEEIKRLAPDDHDEE